MNKNNINYYPVLKMPYEATLFTKSSINQIKFENKPRIKDNGLSAVYDPSKGYKNINLEWEIFEFYCKNKISELFFLNNKSESFFAFSHAEGKEEFLWYDETFETINIEQFEDGTFKYKIQFTDLHLHWSKKDKFVEIFYSDIKSTIIKNRFEQE